MGTLRIGVSRRPLHFTFFLVLGIGATCWIMFFVELNSGEGVSEWGRVALHLPREANRELGVITSYPWVLVMETSARVECQWNKQRH